MGMATAPAIGIQLKELMQSQVNEHPILFSTPMVKAILEGRKTVTRRVVQVPRGAYGFYVVKNNNGEVTGVYAHDEHERTEKPDGSEWVIRPRYGNTGDILWVRETFYKSVAPDGSGIAYYFKVSNDGERVYDDTEFKWRPSIHMPRAACRLKLEIVSIGIERLHEITEVDAIREGVVKDCDYGTTGYRNYLKPEETVSDIDARSSFETLWQSINGKESWDANPWVWRIEFKKL